MKLEKRGNGWYYIRYRWNRRRSLKTKDRALATQLFNQAKEDQKAGKIIELEKVSKIRLSEFRKEYIEGSNDLPKRSLDVSQGTIDNDKLAFQKFQDLVGDIPMRQVRRKQVDDFKERCLRLGLSVTYINILLRCLRAAFNTSLSVGYISENPFLKKRNQPPVFFRLDERLPRFLSIEELRALFETIKDPDFLFAVETYLYTGLRRAELVRLCVEDIDFSNNMIKVKHTKSHKDRSVPIPEEFRERFRKKVKIEVGRLFSRWSSPDTISRLFHEYAMSAGLSGVRLHDLRHTYATYLRMAGVDLDTIQKFLGHADLKTTQIYAKVVDDQLKSEANKLRFNLGGSGK